MPAKSRFVPKLEAYEQDDGLRSCSLEAQGLWLRLLFVMMRQERGGRLPAADAAGVGSLVGRQAQEIERPLSELEQRGVLSRDETDGTLFCARMVRDYIRYAAAKEYGKGGGNPFLKGAEAATKPAGDNLAVFEEPAPAAPAPTAPQQANMFGEPAPKPPSAGQRLYKEGLEILAGFAGKDLTKANQKAAVVRLLSKMRKEAKNDDLLLDIILRAKSQEPASAIGWIRGAIENGSARLVHTNEPCNDFGIERFCVANALEPATDPEDVRRGKWLAYGKVFDQTAAKVAAAAKFQRQWAVDWQPLMDWIGDGYTSSEIVGVIERWARGTGYVADGKLNRFVGSFPKRHAA